jgi:prepilin-type N-terminal cleavage/methylation domain-containing protein
MRSKRALSIGKAERGFSLVEMAIVLVIIGLVMGATIGAATTLMRMSESRNTQEKVTSMKEQILGFTLSNQRLPAYDSGAGTDELSPIAPANRDPFGRKLVYIYDPQSARSDVPSVVCAKKTTSLSAKYCDNAVCATSTTQPNVAFVVFSTGRNLVNQTGAATTPHTESGTDPSYGGPDGAAGSTKTITLFAPGTPVGIYSATATNPVENDDVVAVVTLDDLRSKVGCQGAPLRIVNTDLPMGAASTAYSATIYAQGGVPVASALGTFRWCVETSVTPATTLTTIAALEVVKADATATAYAPGASGACAAAAQNTWSIGNSFRVRGTGGSNALNTTTAGTYDLTIYVRDDQNADPATLGTTDTADNIVFRNFVLGIHGS